MKIAKTAAIFTLMFAGAASAESPTPWPGYPHRGIESQSPATMPAKAPSASYSVWTDAFVPFGSSAAATGADKGGQSPTSAADLDRQGLAHRRYWEARNEELFATGEPADVLPVRVHEKLNARAFGSPVMSGQ